MMAAETPPKSQSDKFKEAARQHEADEDEARWDERLGKLVKVKPKAGPGDCNSERPTRPK